MACRARTPWTSRVSTAGFAVGRKGIREGKIQCRLKPTGIRPKFVEKFEVQGIHLPPGLFTGNF